MLSVGFIFGGGCRRKGDFIEMKDKDLSIQVMKMNRGEDSDMHEYRIRIVPYSIPSSHTLQGDMWYKADSTIYLFDGTNKVYPVIMEPIANGIKNSYEYLLTFSKTTSADEVKLNLVYADRYINNRTYILDLNKD